MFRLRYEGAYLRSIPRLVLFTGRAVGYLVTTVEVPLDHPPPAILTLRHSYSEYWTRAFLARFGDHWVSDRVFADNKKVSEVCLLCLSRANFYAPYLLHYLVTFIHQ